MPKSNNQGPFTPEEYQEMHRRARKKRLIEMITLLENNGYTVRALQKAMDKEDQQMINILEARGYTVTKKEEITELEGIDNEQEAKEEEAQTPAGKKESSEGKTEEEQTQGRAT